MATVSGCINSNPLFAANSTWDHPQGFDFRLQSGSPAINAGTATGAPAVDIRAVPRSTPPSIGAYEAATGSAATSACDVNGDGVINIQDVQVTASAALALAPCTTADVNRDGTCNKVDFLFAINAALGGACAAAQ
jgi:hypothetical protein